MSRRSSYINRRIVGLLITLAVAGVVAVGVPKNTGTNVAPTINTPYSGTLATQALAKLPVKGRAPMTGYSRDQYGNGWGTGAPGDGSCDTREAILRRDLTAVKLGTDNCTVVSGTLVDPYTGKTITFTRGASTSGAVQIDHIVALGDSWQTGAQQLDASTRKNLYNDPLELLAVDGPANEQKGDGDAATWLPPNKAFRCYYVARQVAVKAKYGFWVTPAEHDAMAGILQSCPDQKLPR
jgi:hypothetical protein